MAIKCYTCGEEITFSKKYLSKSGKQIPLWADMQNTHGHDEQGNPTRQPLPVPQQEPQQQQWRVSKQSKQQQQEESTTGQINMVDLGVIIQTNLTHTKAILAQLDRVEGSLTETKNRINTLAEKLELNTTLDTNKLVEQLQHINDTIAPFLKADVKTASELYNDIQQKVIDRPKEYSITDNEDPASQLGA